MAIDPACQPIANTIAGLETTRSSVAATVPTPPPLDRWKALAQIGDITRQIADQQVLLDACQRQHAARYSADVVVFDTTGGPPAPRQASLWRMDGPAATVLEQTPVTGAGLSFTPPMTGPIGITIVETNPAVQGVDFRSGPLEELPRTSASDPSGRIEIVLGPVLSFTADEIAGWLSALPLPQHSTAALSGAVTLGSADIVWSAVAMGLAAGTIRLTAAGTITVSEPLLGSQSAPFSVELPITFALPVTPGTELGCDVRLADSPSPSLTVGGSLGAIINPIAPVLFSFCGGMVLDVLRSSLNDVLRAATAEVFGLHDLLRIPVVSLRRFEITPAAVTIQPTLAAFGDALSTFVP